MTTQRLRQPEVMADDPFTPGDVVSLVVGGPPMTVERIVKAGQESRLTERTGIHCAWFDKENHLHRDVFSVGLLKKEGAE